AEATVHHPELFLVLRAELVLSPAGCGRGRLGPSADHLDPVGSVVTGPPAARFRVAEGGSKGKVVGRAHLAQRPLKDRAHGCVGSVGILRAAGRAGRSRPETSP